MTRSLAAGAIALLTCGCGGVGGGDDRSERSDNDAGRVVARAPAGADGRVAVAGTDSAGAGLLVDVAGHVRRPGVYRLHVGARVHEAITAAGGARRGADLSLLNRAATLVDGQQVLVAATTPTAKQGAVPPGSGSGTSAKVSINAADLVGLDALPGIGPITAGRIIAEREASGPFGSIDDLDRVPGVGPATIEALRDVTTT